MTSTSKFTNPDIGLDFEGTVRLHGYPFEEHFVTTSDGYILRLFRVPHGLNDTYTQNRPAVLLQHGLIEPPDSFVIRGTLLSPAFYLANSGYDVWLANARGNTYSQNHTFLDPVSDPDFWDFTFADQMNDHQANIQYILNQTSLDNLSYFGFATGVASMLVGLIRQNQWFSDRVNLFISFGGFVRLDHIFGPPILFYGSSLPYEILRRYNINSFPPSNDLIENTTSFV